MIRRAKRAPVVVPITSMGDIAFLLIIFFMVTSNFIKNRNIEVEQAASPDIHKVQPTQLTVTMDGKGELRFDGEICPLNTLEGAVSARLKDLPEKRVEVKMDKNLTKDQFMPVFEALSAAGAKIVQTGIKEEE